MHSSQVVKREKNLPKNTTSLIALASETRVITFAELSEGLLSVWLSIDSSTRFSLFPLFFGLFIFSHAQVLEFHF